MTRRLAKFWQRPIRLDEPSSDGQRRSWIMYMPEGEYTHPECGKLNFSREKLQRFKDHFDHNVRKIPSALEADHAASTGDSRATGGIERLERREATGDAPAGLWACICWTPYGAQLMHDREYRYFSPEFGNHTDEETGDEVKDVAIGGALTNRPFLKVMPAVRLAEVSRTPWAGIKKSSLPRACFLIQGDPDVKATWKLPVYESNGKGGRGKLNINGVKAAWAAVNGAHTGTPMGIPASVKARLQRWVKQFSQAAQAAEGHMAAETIRLMGAESAVGKRPGRAMKKPPKASKGEDYDPTNPDDANEFADDTEGEEMADDEEGEQYADGEDEELDDSEDTEAMDDAEDEPPPRRMSRKMSGNLANFKGKKAAPFTKADGKGRKMSESYQTMQLREQNAQMQVQLAELRYATYESSVGKILAAWRDGQTLTFAETHSRMRDPRPGDRGIRQARVVMSPKAERKIAAYLLSEEGYRLSESSRMAFLPVAQTCLSEALVDMSVRGSAWDQEARETLRGRSTNAHTSEDEVMQLAEGYAASDKKILTDLVGDEFARYYGKAAARLGWRGN